MHYEAEKQDDLMLLSYTSGSTGRPKGVMLSFRSFCSNLAFAQEVIGTRVQVKRGVVILPMAHMFSFSFDLLYGMTNGAHLYIITKVPTPKVLLSAFDKVKPDYFLCVPMIMEKMKRRE